MFDLLPLMILIFIGFIVILLIILNKRVSDIETELKSKIDMSNHQVEELDEMVLLLRDELLNMLFLYVEDREMLEKLAFKQKVSEENENGAEDEIKIAQLMETKEKLITQVEVYRQELMELNTIHDKELRLQRKREIESGMKTVKTQITEYQQMEKAIISNIIDRKKNLVK